MQRENAEKRQGSLCTDEADVKLQTDADDLFASMEGFLRKLTFWQKDTGTTHPRADSANHHKASSAVIHPEAIIQNLSNQPERITVGKETHIRGMLLVYRHGGSITIGDHCFLGPQSDITSMNEIIIGNRVLISHHVQILDSTGHSLDAIERHRHFLQIIGDDQPRTWAELPGVRSAPIIIEDDVWIGFGSTILKGVRIGRGSVIGARSVVTQDVEPGMLYLNQIVPTITPLPPRREDPGNPADLHENDPENTGQD